MQLYLFKNKRGISLLIAVIIISAMGLLIAIMATFTSLDAVQIGLRQNEALEAFTGTDGCAEQAIAKLRNDTTYLGEAITIGDTVCTVTVSGVNPTKTIRIQSMNKNIYSRDIEITVDFTSGYHVISWRELTN